MRKRLLKNAKTSYSNISKNLKYQFSRNYALSIYPLEAIYTFIPKNPNFWENLSVRVAVLPLIAGISYEFLKYSAKNLDNFIVKIAVKPGLWFQRLTTKEPDEDQLEVGIKSLKTTLEMEKKFK